VFGVGIWLNQSVHQQEGYPLSFGGSPEVLYEEGDQGCHGLPHNTGEPPQHQQPPEVKKRSRNEEYHTIGGGGGGGGPHGNCYWDYY